MQHIRSLGQAGTSMGRVYGFIESNLDLLYEHTNRPLLQQKWSRLNSNSKRCKGLNLTSSRARGVRAQSQQQEYAEKNRFKEELFKYAEKLVLERRSRIRRSKIDVTRFKCRPELNYEEKNSFVENNIENSMLYFKASTLGEAQEVNYMLHLRNILLKNEIKLNEATACQN